MLTRPKSQRVGIFIDIQNLYHSAKHLYGGRVNYRELIRELVAGRQLIRTVGYVVKSETILATLGETHGRDPRDEQRREARGLSSEAAFFDALTKNGIELRMKDLQVFPGGMKKADWDVGMAVDAIRMASFLDVIILVTGDGDFIPLVEYLKWGLGREVEVAAFGRSASSKLKEAADFFVNLEEVPKVILKR
ncbi:NYN domain-containing protein [Candidatus Wolfebacteria bacterium]|nr:NYN domain-containing protein [Candidatus Wolfebacteria bacterium]